MPVCPAKSVCLPSPSAKCGFQVSSVNPSITHSSSEDTQAMSSFVHCVKSKWWLVWAESGKYFFGVVLGCWMNMTNSDLFKKP